MKSKKILNIEGAMLDNIQLEQYLEKLASNQILSTKSSKKTYPIPRLKENIDFIWKTYLLLSNDIKNKTSIHPAGEWILDNYYILEKTFKIIVKNLSIKKYKNLIGIANGKATGFARAYVIATEIVSYTDGKLDGDLLTKYLRAYQKKKTLNMDELWALPIFINIALIEKIRNICEKIYLSQLQKHKVDDIISRLIEFNPSKAKYTLDYQGIKLSRIEQSKYPFVEYMSHRLKKYGKKAFSYVEALDEQVKKSGTSVHECINTEHFDIASKKISIGNSFSTISTLNRLNFVEIFNNINGVEEVLRQDPSGVYKDMDNKTKEVYRASIEEISKKTKISELYIAKKCIELSAINSKLKGNKNKASHVGYYLISKGKEELYTAIGVKIKRKQTAEKKSNIYILTTSMLSIAIACFFALTFNTKKTNFAVAFIVFIFSIILIKSIIVKTIQYISSLFTRPKIIPKMDFSNGIPSEYSSMVVIPTIVKNKEKVIEMMKKLEVYYYANKSENIYFTLLGDCSCEETEITDFDKDICKEGVKLCKELNEKHHSLNYPIFNFIYRKRTWCECENAFLGWERKRGLLNQFNEYILGNTEDIFLCNTFENNKKNNKTIPNIKYVITLDSDTNLVLNSAFDLVGAMAHILNTPEIDDNRNIVVNGYGIIQPAVGINLNEARKSLFTKIFSGTPGTDSYTSSVSDFYQDHFEEGIYTGKGIYDLKVFSKILSNEIPDNTVLSHDLLEGCYLKCGLASDIMLMDGFPNSYRSYKSRLSRWIRGDAQILGWIKSTKLNCLSKYKIINNIERGLLEVCSLVLLILNIFIKSKIILLLSIFSIIFPFFLELIGRIIHRKNGEILQKKFVKDYNGNFFIFIKALLEIMMLSDKAVMSITSLTKAWYRITKSKKHLLEWTTAEEAEKGCKSDFFSMYKNMVISVLIGFMFALGGTYYKSFSSVIIGFLWIIAPLVMSFISRKKEEQYAIHELNEDEVKYVNDIAYRTWKYFKEYLNKNTNFLPPDNYQEDRKNKVVYRTSPTNIGLAILSVVSSYDLGFETKENTIALIEKMLDSIDKLPKWYGHLYNWYNIENMTPLYPRYISSVDSGNFVGYLFVLKQFIIEVLNDNEIDRKKALVETINQIIGHTDFSKLFDISNGLFSIGYNIEENKMTESYYDLLASESRQTSLIAIAKKDVSPKHWKNIGRALTTLNKYKGLVSWSGTSFEYLMPSVIVKRYEGSLIDESCKFMIMSQVEYAKKLGITWGISESAFNLKDFKGNYQYKAFGIPWLGLKRGLADEMVVSSYGAILAINDYPKLVIDNIKKLDKLGMYEKYGFYESVDYTPGRVSRGKNAAIVRTYMAHHQGLILLSINNLVNKNILQKRFFDNPEIQSVDILLQERMPNNVIITKEKKEKIGKIKYVDYSYYSERCFKGKEGNINEFNLTSNNGYTILIDKNGNGYSRYGSYALNRYKTTDILDEGILFYIKNVRSKKIWSPTNIKFCNHSEEEKYTVKFFPDKSVFSKQYQNIKTDLSVLVAPEDRVEIRNLQIENIGEEDAFLEVSGVFEPVLSTLQQDYAHKAFNKMFFSFEIVDNLLIIRRKSKVKNDDDLYLAVMLYCDEYTSDEFEINKKDLCGRNNFKIPSKIVDSIPFSNNFDNTTNPIVALRKSIKIEPKKKSNISLLLSVSDNKEKAITTLKKYTNDECIERAISISKAQSEAKIQYLGIQGNDVNLYQRILSRCITKSGKSEQLVDNSINYAASELWKYGISGNNIIISVFIGNIAEIEIIETIIKALEYYDVLGVNVDLVIIDEEEESYEKYVKEAINEIINRYKYYSSGSKCTISILSNLSDEEKSLFQVRSNMVIYGCNGRIDLQIDEMDYDYQRKNRNINKSEKKKVEVELEKDDHNQISSYNEEYEKNLLFYNGYGGFSADGKEYVIVSNKKTKTPLVWSNVIANEKFGTAITEAMGGYTWCNNSRLKRITTFSNDPIEDMPSEIIYLQDTESKELSTIAISPIIENENYKVVHGFGYSKYSHIGLNIDQLAEVFVPQKDKAKIYIIHLKNLMPQRRKIKVIYYIKLALDEDEIKSDGYIDLEYYRNSNMIALKNIAGMEFKDYVYVTATETIDSFTGNLNEFIGNGSIDNPEGIMQERFSNENTLNNKNMLAVCFYIELESLERKDLAIILGSEESIIDCKNTSYKYDKTQNCYKELENVKKYWNHNLQKIKIETPDEDINVLFNGWILYQTLSSRIYGRSGFYQSGGAWGFRDQLQDVLSLKYINPEFEKNQIIKHSMRQFVEGDALHWWHEDNKRGIRTRFSDDYLWLVYTVEDYIDFTGDESILNIETPYVIGNPLEDGVDEKYDVYEISENKESIFLHCLRACKKACNFGKHGLCLIGSGDWNDGFSNVGNKGIGESVWLSFFVFDVLSKFIPICEKNGFAEEADFFREVTLKLKKDINLYAWDGRWYKRAFCDDGNELGTIHNRECKIDSIAQSWAVISNAGDNDKKYIAMESMENHLVDKEHGIIKLLDPPFEKSNLSPGYIKSYLPGTRENGGQYTHAAIWAIIAESILGFGDKAADYLKMISPIEHSKTKMLADRYKVEPYVIAADIYGAGNLAGVGGWTWYTGSSSWYYVCVIKYILGINISNGYLEIKPCIPSRWDGFKVKYRYGVTMYNIEVINEKLKNGRKTILLNGLEIEDGRIILKDDGSINNIQVII